ncbi:HB1, ASXL, restriction endonuclease HTH domain [Methylobacterium phyllostachyos]|uniref:HB1, ASXL, restriction endonuclease HTH domain n=1 Tax=Methylobacterium phyllostachyos TaxID=582672 RepID=A0A1H0DAF2_9HYPH|nr:HTH domain-containing protein [Methylobacterium phyllostachyos]SDN67217.1 HB1, ASXL, restriction endonuclease HTH domain [Methylobacterium phyllostachyos]
MALSDAEIELRLAALRRQREALDREIADLVLYQELGRRLAAGAGTAVQDRETGSDADHIRAPILNPVPNPIREGDAALQSQPAPPRSIPGTDTVRAFEGGNASAGSAGAGRSGIRAAPPSIPPAIAFTEDAAGARRYGRALVQAACAALAQAGRPLHAAEILEVLSDQGFTLPGRDPVAALNTRLWKRSGPDGPLRRVGEATYALAADSPPV